MCPPVRSGGEGLGFKKKPVRDGRPARLPLTAGGNNFYWVEVGHLSLCSQGLLLPLGAPQLPAAAMLHTNSFPTKLMWEMSHRARGFQLTKCYPSVVRGGGGGWHEEGGFGTEPSKLAALLAAGSVNQPLAQGRGGEGGETGRDGWMDELQALSGAYAACPGHGGGGGPFSSGRQLPPQLTVGRRPLGWGGGGGG